MTPDFVIKDVRLAGQTTRQDIAVTHHQISGIAPDIAHMVDCPIVDGRGMLATSGLIETHIHLDKAGIVSRCTLCSGTLEEAIRETARVKPDFTEDDIYTRAEAVLCKAIAQGTTAMRSFVELDPRAGFRGLDALKALRRDYAHLIDVSLCAFAQEGLTNEPETLAMLDQALTSGADLVGGCPYTDPDPETHVTQVFDLAEKHGVAVDFHVDFDLDPNQSSLPLIVAETTRRKLAGRVSVGHATKLSALPPEIFNARCDALIQAGVALTVLPATDLYLMGRDRGHLVPRGVTPAHRMAEQGGIATLSTNNVMNPFTPFGDASLMRMANLYANVAQAGTEPDLNTIFSMITDLAARLSGQTDYGLTTGAAADIVLFDAVSPAQAVAEVAPARIGFKRGRQSFAQEPAELFF